MLQYFAAMKVFLSFSMWNKTFWPLYNMDLKISDALWFRTAYNSPAEMLSKDSNPTPRSMMKIREMPSLQYRCFPNKRPGRLIGK